MLTPADDYPLHQTPEPFAYAQGERNFYDRFFFNGYDETGEIFFAFALGVYPQLGIMDAAFSLRHGGKQINVRASKEMKGDRLDLDLGVIKLTLTRPLEETLIEINAPDANIVARLVALGAHFPIEEPRFTRRHGTRLLMDVTRATQNITWQGSLSVGGKSLSASALRGTRDRSWGIRAIGAQDAQPSVPASAPQFYWLWSPCYLKQGDSESGHFFIHSNDDETGAGWNRHAQWYDKARATTRDFHNIELTTQYASGTRRITRLDADLGEGYHASFEALPAPPFYMQGLGYLHPEWGHGSHHGVRASHHDTLEIDKAEAQMAAGALHHIHIQQPVRVRFTTPEGEQSGQGALEQLLLGAHAPSGFTDILDA